jgi:hypothetical protein
MLDALDLSEVTAKRPPSASIEKPEKKKMKKEKQKKTAKQKGKLLQVSQYKRG